MTNNEVTKLMLEFKETGNSSAFVELWENTHNLVRPYTYFDPSGARDVEDFLQITRIALWQAINSYNFDGEDDLYGFNSTLNKITTIPHSNTIKEAWLKTEVAIKSYHVVNRNSNKFSDDKVMRKMAKDFE